MAIKLENVILSSELNINYSIRVLYKMLKFYNFIVNQTMLANLS